MEQEEYTRDEIEWSYIDYVDNQDILDLIEKVWISLIAAKHLLHQFWLYIAKVDFFLPT